MRSIVSWANLTRVNAYLAVAVRDADIVDEHTDEGLDTLYQVLPLRVGKTPGLLVLTAVIVIFLWLFFGDISTVRRHTMQKIEIPQRIAFGTYLPLHLTVS
jgi:hypothetical protein